MDTTKMKKVRINRKTWSRGGVNQPSKLCNAEGNMCCLGFAIHQIAKVKKDSLVGKYYPRNFYKKESFFTNAYKSNSACYDSAIIENNEFSSVAAKINDNAGITEVEREIRLIDLFSRNGIVLEFYN